jgi:nitroimidazol reductase NimA-like FMN-containing flavoprotein (pyridoxamine 5'-phosphate oxidase superfamily)
MAGESEPVFREMERAECDALLARHHVGRIAYTFHDRVDIEPINYVYDDGWLYGRTAPGTKLATIVHHRWVAFEVDEVTGLFDWRSVVVHGALYLLTEEGPGDGAKLYEHAVQLLRSLFPQALTAADPVGFRRILFRIHASEVTGREARLG